MLKSRIITLILVDDVAIIAADRVIIDTSLVIRADIHSVQSHAC